MDNFNFESEDIQNLITFYINYQENKITLDDIKNFFIDNKTKKEDFFNLFNKIDKIYNEKYLERCEKVIKKKKPNLYYNSKIISFENFKKNIINKRNEIYKLKLILENYYHQLNNYILETHKKYNFDLIIKKKIKCSECFNFLMLKNIIDKNTLIYKQLDINEAYCFFCKSIFKLYAPSDLVNNFSLDSKEPYITKVLVDTL